MNRKKNYPQKRGKPKHISQYFFFTFFPLIAFFFIFLQGCTTVGPDYKLPEIIMPDAWHQAAIKGLSDGTASFQTWWTHFNDPALTSLIERSTTGNLDLKEAIARMQEARARLGISTGERYPDLNSSGDAIKLKTSESFSVSTTQKSRNDEFLKVGLDATWELDLWGRISRLIESGEASLAASVEAFRDVLVVLYAEVAKTYVNVRTLQKRLHFAKSNVKIQRDTLKLTEDQFKAGIISELDVQQAQLNLSRTESTIPTIESQIVQSINRLSVLLGNHPGTLYEELIQSAPIPKQSEKVMVGVPTDILRQRPDIRQAERELAAQTARIGVATAELYPRLTISGAFNFASLDLKDLFEWRSRTWNIGPSFTWNLFDGGRVHNQIKAEQALTDQALARYEKAVLTALEDVENAMVAYIKEDERRAFLEQSVSAAESSVRIVEQQYKLGITDFQNLLDMQRSLFVLQDELAASEGQVTQELIRFYKAMGGGWPPESMEHTAARKRLK
jgi:multidrug efflux system outer membrane protein